MNEFELFIHKYNELKQLSKALDHYSMLKASAILRLFFVDKSNLVDQVNKTFSKKIYFTLVESDFFLFKKMPELKPSYQYDSISPDGYRSDLIKNVNKDYFLAMPLLCYEGELYTVRQIIKFGANVLGGVHYDPTSKQDPDYVILTRLKDDLEDKLEFIRQLGGYMPPLNVLVPLSSVSEVAIQSLATLYEKVSSL